jgi:succinate-semialdehyde dehydrogenase/glutarate-semialdehyde dehydrogenase
MITVSNPYNQQTIKQYAEMSETALQQRLDTLGNQYYQWSKRSFGDRAKGIESLIGVLEQHKQAAALAMTNEMGKPITQSLPEIEKCQSLCQYYLDEGESFLSPRSLPDQAYQVHQPTGIIFGVMPWNFPFWQVFRYVIPNLLVGNVCALKHAPNVTGVAMLLEQLFQEAGLGDVFAALVIDVKQVPSIIQHPCVAGVTFTGSARTGRVIAGHAGQALKKVVLELGGSDPCLVLADAEVNQAVQAIIAARLNNAGQVCIAPKRIFVDTTIFSEFHSALCQQLTTYKAGNPQDPSVTLGPLARDDLRQALIKQVELSCQLGAQANEIGHTPKQGYFYTPTILTDVKPEMPAFDQELFGPVFSLIETSSDQHALELANQSIYGLSGCIFSKDIDRAERLASQLQVGMCAINRTVRSDPRYPFGGVKQSGFGREMGKEGLHTFTNLKVIMGRHR